MRRNLGSVVRGVSGMPSSVIAWIGGAALPCSGELLGALEALWNRDPQGQDDAVAYARRCLLVAFKRAEEDERWTAERECAAIIARLRRARNPAAREPRIPRGSGVVVQARRYSGRR